MNLNDLSNPFDASDIEWRIGQCGLGGGGKIWVKCLAYVTNRAIMNRLDEVCGPQNWQNKFERWGDNSQLCGISIKVNDEWVTKWDGADNTQVESTKGGLSDSQKRAAVQWGIGRYLYSVGENWADVVSERTDGYIYANANVGKKGEKNYQTFYWKPKPIGGNTPPQNQSGTDSASSVSTKPQSGLSQIACPYCRKTNTVIKDGFALKDGRREGSLVCLKKNKGCGQKWHPDDLKAQDNPADEAPEEPKPEVTELSKVVDEMLKVIGCKNADDACAVLTWATAGEYTDPKQYRATKEDSKAVHDMIQVKAADVPLAEMLAAARQTEEQTI